VTILFGTVLTSNGSSAAVLSGIYYWGSLIYIIAGSLCIAAEDKINSTSSVCLMRGSYGMNTASAVTAGIAMIIILVDVVVWSPYNCSERSVCYLLLYGIVGVLFVFTLLEFVVSIYLSASTCKANDCCTPQVSSVVINSILVV
ncbi:hypothetical protein PO909_000654, partial [Leuciscus waleckii]